MSTARAPRDIMRELSRKAAGDVTQAILRCAALVEHPNDRNELALVAVTGALGLTVGLARKPGAWGEGYAPEQVVEGLWDLRLKPIVLGVLQGRSNDEIRAMVEAASS